MNALALAVLVVSSAAVLYAQIGYPLLLSFLAERARRRSRTEPMPPRVGPLPLVSVLVAAWNEDAVIASKIENALSQDYPAERLEVVVVSDGSDDKTNEIVEARASERVRFLALARRGGKARALRHAASLARGDVLVLTDANAFFARDAVSRLVERLRESEVACAFGNVKIREEGCPWGASEGLFWRIERRIQRDESALESAIGVDGALYAIRRERFVAPPDGAVLDDLEVAIEATRRGGRVVYEPRAVAWEEATPSLSQEFRRKARIAAGAVQALRAGRLLPDRERPWLWLEFASHKLLRWAEPVFLALALAASVVLARESLAGEVVLGVQLAFYGLALVSLPIHARVPLGSLSLPLYFSALNLAALVGLARGIRGKQGGAWKRADRRPVTPSASASAGAGEGS